MVVRAVETRRMGRVGPADILRLQRTVGNASTAQLLAQQETEPKPAASLHDIQTAGVQREAAEEDAAGGDAGGCC